MRAILNNAKISEKKMVLAAKLVRRLDVSKAQMQLKFAGKKSCDILLKVLNSAIANSKLSNDELFIDRVEIGRGMQLKRHNPRAKGRSDIIIKRFCNIRVELKKKEVTNGK